MKVTEIGRGCAFSGAGKRSSADLTRKYYLEKQSRRFTAIFSAGFVMKMAGAVETFKNKP